MLTNALTHAYKTIKQSNSLHKIANVARFGFFFTTNPSTFVSLRSSGIFNIASSFCSILIPVFAFLVPKQEETDVNLRVEIIVETVKRVRKHHVFRQIHAKPSSLSISLTMDEWVYILQLCGADPIYV